MMDVQEQDVLFRGGLEQNRASQWRAPQVKRGPGLESEPRRQLACRIGRLAEIDEVQLQPGASQEDLFGLAIMSTEYGAERFMTADELVQGVLQGFRINYSVQGPSLRQIV